MVGTPGPSTPGGASITTATAEVSQKWQRNFAKLGVTVGSEHADFLAMAGLILRSFGASVVNIPRIMARWLETEAELSFSQDPAYELTRRDRRNRLRFQLESLLGIEISKKHYRALDR